MAAKQILDKYRPTIGIECHVQLSTKTKLFARVSNDAKEAEPNTTVSPICFGLPGVLPYLNEGAIELAVKAGHALNAKINHFSKFDRKHYFYPDLPKGYQITQYDQPIIGEGYVEVPDGGEGFIKIGIERAHLEEDAGKLTHPGNADYSLVDLNRAGTPLLEIVSKPDIKSPEAAKAYARELYLLMKYAGVSDVDLYHGHMRFDVNISVAEKGSDKLGTRAEVKNLNSFRAVEKAAQYEFERQVEVLEKGDKVIQETRGWHDDKQKTFSQRSKEEAHDYRYFPEPDLPPIELSREFINEVQTAMPEPISRKREKLQSMSLKSKDIETLLDVSLENGSAADYVLEVSEKSGNLSAEMMAFYILNFYIREGSSKNLPTAEQVGQIHKMRSEGLISTAGAHKLSAEVMPAEDIREFAKRHGHIQTSDRGEIESMVNRVINENPKAVADYNAGEQKAIGFLTGQVMKASKGKANPKVVQDLLREHLEG